MISIILPVYYVEEYIENCLQTLLSQTYKDIEIICVDDCTLDNSVTVIKKYQKLDSRIRLVHHDENRGLGGARNTGIDYARGEYLMFIDSDDYVHRTMVEKMYRSVVLTGSDAVVCGIMQVYETNQTMKPHTTFHYDHLASEGVYNIKTDKQILTDMWPSACNKLYRADIIQDNHIRFKERILYEDHTFFMNILVVVKPLLISANRSIIIGNSVHAVSRPSQ